MTKVTAKKIENHEKKYERELKKAYSEKGSIKNGVVEIDNRLESLLPHIRKTLINLKLDEICLRLVEINCKFPKIILKRKIPEPNYETLEFVEDEVKEDQFYIIEEKNLVSFQNFILSEECKATTANYIVDIYHPNADDRLKDALLQLKLSKTNLLGCGPNILETSKERKLDGVICSSIKSILVRPVKLEKEFSETTDKVKVKNEEDVVPLWRRMLMTIDGIGEPEVQAILEIIPTYDELENALEKNSDKLFEDLCQARVIRGSGALERSQRLGPKVAQRIIYTFDESAADFILE